MTAPSNDNRGAPCPICKKAAVAAFQPFCSRRCTDLDLGRWLDGKYAIPAVEPPDEGDLEAALEEALQAREEIDE